MPAPTPKPLSYLKDKEPSSLHKLHSKWIKANGGGDIDPKAIQIVLSSHGAFQKSDENKARNASLAEKREAEKQARLERAEAREAARAERQEAAAARAAARAERDANKSDTPPVKKAAAAKAAPAKKTPVAKTTPTKPASKAPANRAAAKRPTAKAKATAGNFDAEDF